MVRKKLKHVVVYVNILDKFNVGHCGIKVKVTIITSRWLFIADTGKSYRVRYMYVKGGKTQSVKNLPCM